MIKSSGDEETDFLFFLIMTMWDGTFAFVVV